MTQFCQQCQVQHKTTTLLGGEKVSYCQKAILPTINQIDSQKWGSNLPSSKSTRSMEAIEPKKNLSIKFSKHTSYSANNIQLKNKTLIKGSFLMLEIQKQANKTQMQENTGKIQQQYFPNQQYQRLAKRQMHKNLNYRIQENYQNKTFDNVNRQIVTFSSQNRKNNNLLANHQTHGINTWRIVYAKKQSIQKSLINSLKYLSAHKITSSQQTRQNWAQPQQNRQLQDISLTKSQKCVGCINCCSFCCN